MNNYNNVLLLIGSPKGSASSSASLGNYLTSKLEENGWIKEVGYIHKLVKNKESQIRLFSMVEKADLIIMAFPLYVDSLPAPVIKALESISEYRKNLEQPKRQGFAIIVNSGFPEAEQNDIAVNISKIFAQEVGFEWKGGLALGMGGVIQGKPLQERGGVVRNIIKGLDIAAVALSRRENIPQVSTDLISKRTMPKKLYTMVGNFGWKVQAKKYGARKKMYEKPYL
ncbi:MAG: hypothetical protein ACFFDK_04545 [Promethearchaeota archaeon]